MTTMPIAPAPARLPLLRFLRSELKPKGPLLTPFNVISIPVMRLNSSPERWSDVPTPPEPKLSLPGLALA